MEPDCGFTVSQFPLLAVLPVAVNVVRLELLLLTETVCVEARVLPAGNVKLSELGVAVSEVVPLEFTFSVTGTVTAPSPEDTLIYPTVVPEAGIPAPTDTIS